MAIKGLTDTGKKTFPRVAVIRKGSPMTKDANDPKKTRIGRDLTYFRFDSGDDGKAENAFRGIYGNEPRLINIRLPYHTVEENFMTCKEAHLAGGLLHRCDGETTSLLRIKGKKDLSKESVKCPGGCKEVGRLMAILPELCVDLKRLCYATFLTSSKNDIVELTANLEAIYELRGSLKGIPLIIRRIEKEISTPDEKSQSGRARRKKWMLSVEPSEQFVTAFLEASKREAIAAPTERMMLNAAPKALPAFTNQEHAIAADFQNTRQVIDPVAPDFGSEIPDEDDDDDNYNEIICISGTLLKTAQEKYAALKAKGRNGAQFTAWLQKNFSAETIESVGDFDGERLVQNLTTILARIEQEEASKAEEVPPTDAPATGQSLLMDAVEGAADILSKKEIGDALELYGSRVAGKVPEEKAAEAAEYLTKKANAKRFA